MSAHDGAIPPLVEALEVATGSLDVDVEGVTLPPPLPESAPVEAAPEPDGPGVVSTLLPHAANKGAKPMAKKVSKIDRIR
jgi:hypothetical protein